MEKKESARKAMERANETTFGKDYTGPLKRRSAKCQNCGLLVGSPDHPFDEGSCQA